ncbi:hypothetical protein EBX93_00770 [bacterium]|jgi:hypothetical protein|nr:hypothetical protein [bacterium]
MDIILQQIQGTSDLRFKILEFLMKGNGQVEIVSFGIVILLGLIHTSSLEYHSHFIGLTACYGEVYN